MTQNTAKQRISWYRTPIDPAKLAQLNKRSNLKGFGQSLGHLAIIATTGALAWYAVGRFPWVVVLLLLFLHGTVYAFVVNAGHELCHKTVFKTRWLNVLFRDIYSFLGWYNHIYFWTSHQEHHKYTLHPPDDLEVVLPKNHTIWTILSFVIVNPVGFYNRMKSVIRMSFGKIDGEWANQIFPPEATEKRKKLFNWARLMLIGHSLLVIVSIYFELWMLPVLVTLAPFYGGALQFFCNEAQHTGLPDHVSDFRINSRTILLNPVLQFLYWHMNYHIEHHMFAAVPCYNLAKLHQEIEHDLPPTPKSLIHAWIEILPIVRKQHEDPSYRFVPNLPGQAD
jgi:fatty acid desaturase